MTLSASDLMEIRKRELKFRELGEKNNIGKHSDHLIIKKQSNELNKSVGNNLLNYKLYKPFIEEINQSSSEINQPTTSDAGTCLFDTVEVCNNLRVKGNIDCEKDINCSGIVTSSDINLKDNINNIENPFEIINKLNPVSYNYKGSKDTKMGFIAQEVKEVIPSIVKKNNNSLGIEYVNFTALLVKGYQDHEKIIQQLIDEKNK